MNEKPRKPKSTVLQEFEKTIERWSNRNVEDMRSETIDEARKRVEEKEGGIKLISEFPFIGRGNVQRENIVSHEAIERELDEILE